MMRFKRSVILSGGRRPQSKDLQASAYLIAFLLVWLAAPVHAQYATIEGRVVFDVTDAPLPGANVLLESETGETRGAAADESGAFRFGSLLPGRYVLTVSMVSYRPATDTLEVAFGEHLQLVLELEPSPVTIDELIVEGERRPDRPRGAGIAAIPPEALARVPSPGLSADLSGYLTSLPGVVTRGDQGGQLFIRGGTPTQNLVLVDGVPVFQPFHLIGFYSAFPADIISYVDVYAGGFGAEFGGRIASVIDVHTRTGNKQKFEGSAALSPFLSALKLNVPVVPGYVSLMGSVRESFIEQFSPILLGDSLPFHFGDQFVRLHAFLNATSSLSLTFLHSYDRGRLGSTARDSKQIERDNLAVGAHYNYLPSTRAVRFEARAYYTKFFNRYVSALSPVRFSATQGYGGKMDFTYLLTAGEVHFGLFARTNKFRYDVGLGLENVFTTEGGLFVEGELRLAEVLAIQPGVRLHAYTASGKTSISPRLRVYWQPGGAGGAHRFSAASGLYHQQIIGLYNLRDLTDVFIAWRPSEKFEETPQAFHLLAGWDGRLLPWLNVNVETYYKSLHRLTFAAYNDLTGETFTIRRADGASRGIEIRAGGSHGPLYFSAGYGLAKVVYTGKDLRDAPASFTPDKDIHAAPEQDPGAFHPPHDRRHQIDLLVGYDDERYAFSVRWQVGSGLPFTKVYGFYTNVAVPKPTDDFHTDPGELVVDFAEPYAARLPAYHRLDISAARTFRLGALDLVVQGSVINVYNRANIFDYNLLNGQRTNQLPLIPSLGFQVAF